MFNQCDLFCNVNNDLVYISASKSALLELGTRIYSLMVGV